MAEAVRGFAERLGVVGKRRRRARALCGGSGSAAEAAGGSGADPRESLQRSAEPIAIVACPSAIAWWIRQISAVLSPFERLDDVDRPERAVAREPLGHQPRDDLTQMRIPDRAFYRNGAHVAGRIELGVVDPDR